MTPGQRDSKIGVEDRVEVERGREDNSRVKLRTAQIQKKKNKVMN